MRAKLLGHVHNEDDDGHEIRDDDRLRINRRAVGGEHPKNKPADKCNREEDTGEPYRYIPDKR